MGRAPTIGRALATAALAAASAGCWVLNPSFGEDGGATAGGSGTTSGVTGATSTTSSGGESGATIGSETGGASGSSGSIGTTGTSGTSGVSSSSAGSSGTTGSSSGGGGLCPALDEYDNPYANDVECRACLETQCCGVFGSCTGACATAANCVANNDCIGDWFVCPGYSTYEATLIEVLMCVQGVCLDACNLGPCAAQLKECSINPACLATYQCALTCPGSSGGELLKLFNCVSGCDDINQGGVIWGMVSQCFFNQCM